MIPSIKDIIYTKAKIETETGGTSYLDSETLKLKLTS